MAMEESVNDKLLRCVYAHPSSEAIGYLDRLPSNPGRSSAVHRLARSLDLIQIPSKSSDVREISNRARPLMTKFGNRSDLEIFHDSEYVDYLLKKDKEYEVDSKDIKGNSSEEEDQLEFDERGSKSNKGDQTLEDDSGSDCSCFGIVHDSPPFPGMGKYALAVAGAALGISRELRDDRADIGIVWDGGRHHAQRSRAAGFCYINDIALSITELRKQPAETHLKRLDRVMYIDLDLHHGDGVEAAFWTTSRVLTVSIHYHDPRGGFYPLTGGVESCGPSEPSPAASHAINLPIKFPGSLRFITRRSLVPLIEAYKPSVVLIQCGVDGLAGDPIGGTVWGFGLEEMGDCVSVLIEASVSGNSKVMLFGGGGYNTANAARAWSYFTSIALGNRLDLSTEIPFGLEGDIDYGPSYTLDVPESGRFIPNRSQPIENDEYIKDLVSRIDKHITILRNRYCKTSK
ncbi:hypothetical protein BY996DRAFT_6415904 [Phakopsora pachyrhizi]|uniref:histone deacetylase n=1 Tax=Phakopsora pachyrhizi TaxID=170000 RepID=A0AAV0BFI3_PHAPC|nr:hypothetical protein BY996DRAFT_6415904 [Phakopsora pachyrhizi]CAH7685527.1 hypothetical protein PPACK8108_LOCUS20069 [Phakopsora pachyrhizi]